MENSFHFFFFFLSTLSWSFFTSSPPPPPPLPFVVFISELSLKIHPSNNKKKILKRKVKEKLEKNISLFVKEKRTTIWKWKWLTLLPHPPGTGLSFQLTVIKRVKRKKCEMKEENLMKKKKKGK